jgi:hypothetical protein
MPLGKKIKIEGFIKMHKQDSRDSNGERTVVGIDPCSEFLQLAILSPKKKTEFKKLPLSPSITEEILKSTDPSKMSRQSEYFLFRAKQKFPVLPLIKLAFVIVFFPWMFQWWSILVSLMRLLLYTFSLIFSSFGFYLKDLMAV